MKGYTQAFPTLDLTIHILSAELLALLFTFFNAREILWPLSSVCSTWNDEAKRHTNPKHRPERRDEMYIVQKFNLFRKPSHISWSDLRKQLSSVSVQFRYPKSSLARRTYYGEDLTLEYLYSGFAFQVGTTQVKGSVPLSTSPWAGLLYDTAHLHLPHVITLKQWHHPEEGDPQQSYNLHCMIGSSNRTMRFMIETCTVGKKSTNTEVVEIDIFVWKAVVILGLTEMMKGRGKLETKLAIDWDLFRKSKQMFSFFNPQLVEGLLEDYPDYPARWMQEKTDLHVNPGFRKKWMRTGLGEAISTTDPHLSKIAD
eukprot:TRINITY_DN1339_c0_g1_i1.p1 TRINITY_DN1339_c0_g1~~TRINITY_DN1339_c0_g1_i1.p1  ORF type:complete len:312 (-),score=25.82 TRINITY_DN1339_c0_g1_i1:417-1352(-)